MEDKDYLLLEYLSKFEGPVKIDENKMPDEIRANFQFFGLDKYKFPNSIYVRLFELSTYNFVTNRYAGMYEITDLGRTELKKHHERNAPKLFAAQCDSVLKYILQSNKDAIASQEISDYLNIDIETVQLIGDELHEKELVELSITDGYYNFYPMPKADRFARKTSFKEQREKELKTASIQNSFNTTNTTHGANSPVAGGDIQQTITTATPEKNPSKKWYEKLWDKVQEPIFKLIATALVAFISGLLTCKWHNQANNQEPSQTTKSTSQDTLSSTNSLKSDTVLHSK